MLTIDLTNFKNELIINLKLKQSEVQSPVCTSDYLMSMIMFLKK